MTGAALWTAASTRKAIGEGANVRSKRSWRARGVSIDSRAVAKGDLFVALPGPNFDGHDFVRQAFDNGAAASVVSRIPDKLADDAPLVVVEDSLAALNALAVAARTRIKTSIIAVTGSVGKTGTKEALRIAFEAQGPTIASAASFNNHVGVPLSLARTPKGTVYGVFEVGMNHPGEIAPLSRLLRPNVAIITAIAPAHTAFFDTLEDIADAKAEIFQGMDEAGTAILNRDNPYFERLAKAARASGIARVISFGTHEDTDARLIECVVEPDATRVTAAIGARRLDYRIGVSGRHWAINSLAVLAAVDAAGADVAAAAGALAGMSALAGRGRRHGVRLGTGKFDLIDESYNANPASMRAAIETLGLARTRPGGRRIAVLGDMLELGRESSRLHAALAAPLAENGVDMVFTAGEAMTHLRAALAPAMRGAHAPTAAELAPAVVATVRAGDIVTVKGSLGSRMAGIIEALLDIDGAPSRAAKG